LAAAAQLGASQISVFSRSPLIAGSSNFVRFSLDDANVQLSEFDAVISTLPAGVADGIARSLTSSGGTLLDVVYHPRPTELQGTWSALGGNIVGGERMLLHQAAKQFELMTGHRAPVEAMNAALLAKLD
jgi:shikimate dehydrogenase